MTCIITGCALEVPDENKVVWGDLHLVGGAYVFLAVQGPGQAAAWQYDEEARVPDVTKTLIVKARRANDIFERRGVIVINPDCTELNAAAKRYLKI